MLSSNNLPNIREWDLKTGYGCEAAFRSTLTIRTHTRDYVGHDAPISYICFLNGKYDFVSGDGNGVMLWWNRPERSPQQMVHQHTESIGIMVPSGNCLFTGSHDRTVRVWDTATANCIRALEGHPSYILGITLSPDSTFLRAACGQGGNGEFRIWNWMTGELIAICYSDARTPSQYVNIDGYLVTCGIDGNIRTWTQAGELVDTFHAHDSAIRAIAKVRRFAVTGGGDGRLKVWDLEKRTWLMDLQSFKARTVSNFTVVNGKLAVGFWITEEGGYRVQVWELETIKALANEIFEERMP